MFEGISVIEFNETFSCNNDCLSYLYDLKWKNGYTCRNCGGKTFWKGRTDFHARCRNCDYDESATANTVFHKIKIPLIKAFSMAFRISISKKAISSMGLSREFKISQHAAWFFKRKLQEAVGSIDNDRKVLNLPASAEVRSTKAEEKNLTGSVGVLTVSTKDYHLIKSEYYTLDKKICFTNKDLPIKFHHPNVVFQNFKAWMNGIHHHCSVSFLQGYLDEFFFRFHFRDKMDLLWHRVIECFVKGTPYIHDLRRALSY